MGDTKVTELTELTDPVGTDWLHVVDNSASPPNKKMLLSRVGQFINVKNYGVVGDGVTDNTAAMITAMTAGAGGTIYFPDGDYLQDRIKPESNTTIILDSGVTITRADGGTYCFYYLDVSNVHIYCNGADLDGSAANGLHTVSILGSTDCSLHDAHINSSGSSSTDGIYIGNSSTGCKRILIRGGSVANALRNGISIVAGVSCHIDGVEIYGTTGSPGSGIDLEANNYTFENKDNLIENCELYNNQTSGIHNAFADRTVIRNNICRNNTTAGIAATSGGNTFKANLTRNNVDRRGVSAFDQATGKISIGGDLDTVPLGICVFFSTTNGATLPGGLTSNIYTVSSHVSGSSTDILVGSSVDYGEITSFSGAETGTLDADPDVSEITMLVYGVSGQSTSVVIEDNKVYDNTQEGIVASSSRDAVIRNNLVYNNGEEGIVSQFVRNPTIENNTVYTDTPVAFSGIRCSFGAYGNISGNHVSNNGGAGLEISACSYSHISNNDMYNCGELGSTDWSSNARIVSSFGVILTGNIGRNSEDYAATLYGLFTDNITECHFTDNIFKLAGPDNAGSINIGEAGHFYSNNVKYDGTLYVYV